MREFTRRGLGICAALLTLLALAGCGAAEEPVPHGEPSRSVAAPDPDLAPGRSAASPSSNATAQSEPTPGLTVTIEGANLGPNAAEVELPPGEPLSIEIEERDTGAVVAQVRVAG